MKKTLLAVISLAVLAATGLGVGFWINLNHYLNKPANPSSTVRCVVTVSPGEGLGAVADTLYQDGLITHPFKFKLVGRLKKYDRKIAAGVYELSASMPPRVILDILKSGKARFHKITIPEGFNLAQIADRIEKTELCKKDEFLSLAENPSFTSQIKIPAKTCEGYLFPDTYYFSDDSSCKQIILTMVEQFRRTFNLRYKRRAHALGFTVHEIMTLASLIEKETGIEAERPIISSVFHNRLKKNMRLASDPTVIYGMKHYSGNITREDLNHPTPYNTYLIPGLPPGPIASPGKPSIEAALYPAKTDYLFFVAKPDKTHQFSVTLEEHNRAVEKYQLKREGSRL